MFEMTKQEKENIVSFLIIENKTEEKKMFWPRLKQDQFKYKK